MNHVHDSLSAVILAAGWGRRAHGPKALLRFKDGRTFLDVVIEQCLAVTHDIVVVLGPWGDARMAGGARVVLNLEPDRGQISSLRLGLDALSCDVKAALVVLVDHPFVTELTYKRLAEAHTLQPESIIVPVVCKDGTRLRGHPVVFPRWAFDELRGCLADEGGARAVMHAYGDKVLEVEVNDLGTIMDIDTHESYLSALERCVERQVRQCQ